MFDFLKRNVEEEIYSPITGKCIPLSDVKDEVFAKKMVGEGVGLVFDGDTVYAPCDGKVIMIASTKHAVGFKSRQGNEVLVHIGLETVEFNGEGFEILVKEGETVKLHQPVAKIDTAFFKEKNIDLTSPLVITNASIENVIVIENNDVDLNTVVCKVKKGEK